MMDVPADSHRDPGAMAKLSGIAAQILERHGVDFLEAGRSGGWSNATWLTGGLALRIAVEAGTDHLHREARLARLLPPEVGYPQVIATGVTDGYEWLLAKKVAGRNLRELWPMLDWDARISAVHQLWAKAESVHRVDVGEARAVARSSSPFYASSKEEAAASLMRLEQARVLAGRQVTVLGDALDRFWVAIPSAQTVLNHGDLCRENALWDHGQIVALLDFEYAMCAPVELDLNELLKAAYAPHEGEDPLPDPGLAGRARMQEAVADIAAVTSATVRGADLLLGYAILLELWSMENRLSKWDGVVPFTSWQPYRAITSLSDRAGGYLAPVLARLARAT